MYRAYGDFDISKYFLDFSEYRILRASLLWLF